MEGETKDDVVMVDVNNNNVIDSNRGRKAPYYYMTSSPYTSLVPEYSHNPRSNNNNNNNQQNVAAIGFLTLDNTGKEDYIMDKLLIPYARLPGDVDYDETDLEDLEWEPIDFCFGFDTASRHSLYQGIFQIISAVNSFRTSLNPLERMAWAKVMTNMDLKDMKLASSLRSMCDIDMIKNEQVFFIGYSLYLVSIASAYIDILLTICFNSVHDGTTFFEYHDLVFQYDKVRTVTSSNIVAQGQILSIRKSLAVYALHRKVALHIEKSIFFVREKPKNDTVTEVHKGLTMTRTIVSEDHWKYWLPYRREEYYIPLWRYLAAVYGNITKPSDKLPESFRSELKEDIAIILNNLDPFISIRLEIVAQLALLNGMGNMKLLDYMINNPRGAAGLENELAMYIPATEEVTLGSRPICYPKEHAARFYTACVVALWSVNVTLHVLNRHGVTNAEVNLPSLFTSKVLNYQLDPVQYIDVVEAVTLMCLEDNIDLCKAIERERRDFAPRNYKSPIDGNHASPYSLLVGKRLLGSITDKRTFDCLESDKAVMDEKWKMYYKGKIREREDGILKGVTSIFVQFK
jgi:hypothetical protein